MGPTLFQYPSYPGTTASGIIIWLSCISTRQDIGFTGAAAWGDDLIRHIVFATRTGGGGDHFISLPRITITRDHLVDARWPVTTANINDLYLARRFDVMEDGPWVFWMPLTPVNGRTKILQEWYHLQDRKRFTTSQITEPSVTALTATSLLR